MLPAWLARAALPLVFIECSDNDKYRKHIQKSIGVVIFVGGRSDKAHWVEAGRACQRFALQSQPSDPSCRTYSGGLSST
jgi:hypothetical protein